MSAIYWQLAMLETDLQVRMIPPIFAQHSSLHGKGILRVISQFKPTSLLFALCGAVLKRQSFCFLGP